MGGEFIHVREGTAAEFAKIRSLRYVAVRHMPSKRCHDVILSYCGQIVAQKTEIYKWNRPVSATYLIDEEFLNSYHFDS